MSFTDAARLNSFYQDRELKRQAEKVLSDAKALNRKVVFAKKGVFGSKLFDENKKELNMNKTTPK